MTTWINKDKFKEEDSDDDDFRKEGFADISLNKNPLTNPLTNPLEIFLKASPLKSIFERKPVDSRMKEEDSDDDSDDDDSDHNDDDDFRKADSLDTNLLDTNTFTNLLEIFSKANPFKSFFDKDVKESYDNIKPLGNPDTQNAKKDAKKDTLTNSQKNDDANRIHSIIVSLFSLFISLFVSYNWYFNFTEGFSKRLPFHEKFDFVNYLYFFTEYFYKIIRFFDTTISVKIPDLVKDFFMKRFLFILIFMNSFFVVKYAILFLSGLYKYANDVINGKKSVNILNYFYVSQEPLTNKKKPNKPNKPKKSKKPKKPKKSLGLFSIYMPLIFTFYVIEGIISSFKSGVENMVSSKINDAVNLDPNPSNAFKDSLMSFKIAHPIVYLIVVIIRVAIVYGPTVSIASFLIFMYFNFYSLFGIFYYLKINKDPIDDSNIYHETRERSFIDMFRHIHAVMNVNHIFTEIKEDPQGMDWLYNKIEYVSRLFFNNLPFIILFYGLFNSIPSVLKIYSSTYKSLGISIIGIISILLFKFMIDENPKIYVIQQDIQNKIENLINSVSNMMTTSDSEN